MGSKVTANKAKGIQTGIRALELRSQRLTYREIGAKLGITEDGARKAVVRRMAQLEEVGRETAAEVRQQELMALDELERDLADAIEQVRAGHGRTDEEGPDYELIAKLADRRFKAMDRRAKLLGLDMPKQMDVTSGGEPLVQLYIPTDGSAEG